MDDPKKLIDFIEKHNLGYLLGRAVTAIVKSQDSMTKEEKLTHLKEARNLLNIIIKRDLRTK